MRSEDFVNACRGLFPETHYGVIVFLAIVFAVVAGFAGYYLGAYDERATKDWQFNRVWNRLDCIDEKLDDPQESDS